MENKHAYLIIAHHREDLLEKLLISLDDENNDIYIHIDRKSKISIDVNTLIKKSRCFMIPRMEVNWAGYSQVKCELKLLENACTNNRYKYYHLLTGATFPLYNQKYIHDFFEKNMGKEFVGYSKHVNTNRVRYIYLFNEAGKLEGIKGALIKILRAIFLRIQNICFYNRTNYFPLTIKKGFAYWSITDSAARYILDNQKLIYKMLKYSLSGDEIFVQTILYNSRFRDNIFDYNNEYDGCLRICPWDDKSELSCNFDINDYEKIMKSNALFALKFEGQDGVELINKIAKNRMIW